MLKGVKRAYTSLYLAGNLHRRRKYIPFPTAKDFKGYFTQHSKQDLDFFPPLLMLCCELFVKRNKTRLNIKKSFIIIRNLLNLKLSNFTWPRIVPGLQMCWKNLPLGMSGSELQLLMRNKTQLCKSVGFLGNYYISLPSLATYMQKHWRTTHRCLE